MGRKRGVQALTVAAGVLALLLATVNVWHFVHTMVPLDAPWQTATGNLLDYRDLVVTPGRFLWHGGNPYDHVSYLRAYPHSQEFDPYAPAWLLISMTLSPLPYSLGAAVYLILGNIALAFFCHWLAQFITARHRLLATCALYAYAQLWYPSRIISSSMICLMGLGVLVAGLRTRDRGRLRGLGLAIALLKPQFGLPVLVYLLCGREVRAVRKGLVLLAVASTPAAVLCLRASGGLIGACRALLGDVTQASGAGAPTGLDSPQNFRTDWAGLAARLHTGSTLPTALAVIAFAACCWMWWSRANRPLAITVCITFTALLALPVHLTYDWVVFLLVVPMSWSLRNALSGRFRLLLVLASTPILAEYRLLAALGLTRLQSDVMHTIAYIVSCGAWLVIARNLRQPRAREVDWP